MIDYVIEDESERTPGGDDDEATAARRWLSECVAAPLLDRSSFTINDPGPVDDGR